MRNEISTELCLMGTDLLARYDNWRDSAALTLKLTVSIYVTPLFPYFFENRFIIIAEMKL